MQHLELAEHQPVHTSSAVNATQKLSTPPTHRRTVYSYCTALSDRVVQLNFSAPHFSTGPTPATAYRHRVGTPRSPCRVTAPPHDTSRDPRLDHSPRRLQHRNAAAACRRTQYTGKLSNFRASAELPPPLISTLPTPRHSASLQRRHSQKPVPHHRLARLARLADLTPPHTSHTSPARVLHSTGVRTFHPRTRHVARSPIPPPAAFAAPAAPPPPDRHTRPAATN